MPSRNHQPSIDKVRQLLRRNDLERFVTIIAVPLVKKRYDGFATDFHWYDLDPTTIPEPIDLLIVDGPHGSVNRYARYPAGPELLPKLSRNARVFVDDANRRDEQAMVQRCRRSMPVSRSATSLRKKAAWSCSSSIATPKGIRPLDGERSQAVGALAAMRRP
jgi:hypothetical protein